MTDTSIFPDPTYRDTVLAPLFEGVKNHFATYMAQINKAHLVMLGDTGILSAADAATLARALAQIDEEVNVDRLTYTGEHEDYFFLVEALLKERLGDLAGALHTARSRNDMDHTLFKLGLRARTDAMQSLLEHLAQALLDKAEAERDTLIVAYTHGQPAQPSTFGHYLSAALECLLRDMERLETASQALEHCPMGAAAITTSGFRIDRSQVAGLLGFEAPQLNAYGCIASVDYFTGLYSAMKLVFLHLGRVVQDMAFWSAFEVGQLYVPNALVQVSSIMPQKRNPVPIEHMRHLASVAASRCDAVINATHNTPFTDMNDSEGEVQLAGYGAFEHGMRMLDLLSAFLPACSINEAQVAKNSDAACITITELADTLVRKEGLSFRMAHEVAAKTAEAVIAAQTSLREGFGPFCVAFSAVTSRNTSLSETDFRDACSARGFVNARTRFGGPAPDALNAAFDVYAAKLAGLSRQHADRRARHARAQAELSQNFNRIKEA